MRLLDGLLTGTAGLAGAAVVGRSAKAEEFDRVPLLMPW